MMGQQSQKESLFYYFRLEDQIPETHLLRLKGVREVAASETRVSNSFRGRLSTTIAPISQISNVLSSLLTFQAAQIAPSMSNITLPPR